MQHPPSFWMRHSVAETEPLRVPTRSDVAIVGGGISGLSAAMHCAARGLTVTLLERGVIGGGSTGRSGGFMAQSSAYDLAELQSLYGLERGLAIYRSVLESLNSIAQTIAKRHIACQFRRSGAYYLAAEPSHIAALEREHHALTHAGIECEIYPADRVPVAGVAGALRTHNDCSVDPSLLARGLAHTMPAAVRIHEHSAVSAVRRRGKQLHVIAATGGRVIADHVILATGGFKLASRMHSVAVPFTSTIAVTEPLPPDATESIGDALLWDTYDIYHYIRRTPDNRLLIGGNDSVRSAFDLRSIDHTSRSLMKVLHRYFPSIDTRPAAAWSGVIALPPDGLPTIETRGDRTLIITDGLLMGWLMGRMAAERISTGRSDYDELYDAGRNMGTAANILRWMPVPRGMKIAAMRFGLAWTIWRSLLDEKVVH